MKEIPDRTLSLLFRGWSRESPCHIIPYPVLWTFRTMSSSKASAGQGSAAPMAKEQSPDNAASRTLSRQDALYFVDLTPNELTDLSNQLTVIVWCLKAVLPVMNKNLNFLTTRKVSLSHMQTSVRMVIQLCTHAFTGKMLDNPFQLCSGVGPDMYHRLREEIHRLKNFIKNGVHVRVNLAVLNKLNNALNLCTQQFKPVQPEARKLYQEYAAKFSAEKDSKEAGDKSSKQKRPRTPGEEEGEARPGQKDEARPAKKMCVKGISTRCGVKAVSFSKEGK